MKFIFDTLKEEYKSLYDNMKISTIADLEVTETIREIIPHFSRYEAVEKETKVHRKLIAALHHKEASGRFSRCLHNGQLWSKVTTIVPKGRGPFKSWEYAAIDALNLKSSMLTTMNIKTVDDWTIEKALYYAERYNGMGYRNKKINSPYLWSGSPNTYTKGGYKFDGIYDENHVIKNIGIAIILKKLDFEDEISQTLAAL